jgi:hypothetical protein
MPYIKPISGHTGLAGARRYLTRKQRALAADYLNLDAPIRGFTGDMPDYDRYDWAQVMDAHRHAAGNDTPWKGRACRTYKHYVVSPDPEDALDLPHLRELTMAWVRENFDAYEVAVVYHDDNANHIPHAHVVVNNTNLDTGRRLQDPDPRALKRSMQVLAQERNLHYFRDDDGGERNRFSDRSRPTTLQQTYLRRAEVELQQKGRYSWVADIRGRVAIARNVAMNEAEFRAVLEQLGVSVADNSPKAARPDWIYSLADHDTRRISGEKLGLSYGREAVLIRMERGGVHLDDANERRLVAIAREAYNVTDLDELHTVAAMIGVNERYAVRCMDDYDRVITRLEAQKPCNKRDVQLAEVVAAKDTALRWDLLPRSITAAPSDEGRTRRTSSQRTARIHRDRSAETRETARTHDTERSTQQHRGDESR